jgi:hypothetical protein
MLAVAAIGRGATDDPKAAIVPALAAVGVGIWLYSVVRHPPTPTRWTRRRVILSALLVGAVTAVTLGVLAWAALTVTDWPSRLIALVGFAFIPVVLVWSLRIVRREARAAPQATDGTPE